VKLNSYCQTHFHSIIRLIIQSQCLINLRYLKIVDNYRRKVVHFDEQKRCWEEEMSIHEEEGRVARITAGSNAPVNMNCKGEMRGVSIATTMANTLGPVGGSDANGNADGNANGLNKQPKQTTLLAENPHAHRDAALRPWWSPGVESATAAGKANAANNGAAKGVRVGEGMHSRRMQTRAKSMIYGHEVWFLMPETE
jgi:hypothetical protein